MASCSETRGSYSVDSHSAGQSLLTDAAGHREDLSWAKRPGCESQDTSLLLGLLTLSCKGNKSLPSAATWCPSAVKLKGMQLLPSSVLVCAACWWHYILHCSLDMQVGCGSSWLPQKPCNSLMALHAKPQCCNGDITPNHWPSQLLLRPQRPSWWVPCFLHAVKPS